LSHLWKVTFLDLARQVDELFEELIPRRPSAAGARLPFLDLHETPDAFIIEVDLPGVAPNEVQILAGERTLVITGQSHTAPPPDAIASRCERLSGTFRRSIELPRSIDPTRATAEGKHGHYRIVLPRKEPGSAPPESLIQITVRLPEES
jgi:HSP20 family protein